MTEYDNTNRGVLFRAKERKSVKHPEYSGSINIQGVEYWLDGWIKDGKSGKFFSLSVKPKDAAKVERFKTAVAEAFPARGRGESRGGCARARFSTPASVPCPATCSGLARRSVPRPRVGPDARRRARVGRGRCAA